ncbi:MAG: hypothetical protein M3335_03960 [Actinomycetota bacterium]|nr:hypothetical protein [Actinomycetota bacterium]
MQTNNRLSVLMLIDESGSLRTTDPQNKRVDGIRAALTGLAGLAETPVNGTKPEVSVLLAGFYAKAHPDPGKAEVGPGAWKPVNRDTIDVLNTTAGDYARLNDGRATDYGTALAAARQLLKERMIEESEGGIAQPCQALIWFTDGRYALPQRVGKAGVGLPKTVPYAPGIRLDQPGAGDRAVAAGKKMMCEPGGLMDELASSGVIRFTVALSTQLSPRDGAFLDSATTGSAGTQRCGEELSPRTGEYLDAGDSDSLFFAFGSLLSAAPPVHVDEVCPGLSCVRGATRFTTVPGLSQFLIRASSGVEGAFLYLKGPGGESVRLASGGQEEVSLAGTEIVARWVSPTAVEVQGEFSPEGMEWVGDWSYQFVDPSAKRRSRPAQSRSSVQLFTELEPVIEGDPALIRGTPTKLDLALKGPNENSGSQLRAGPLLEAASISASLEDPVAGTSTPVRVVGPDQEGGFSTKVKVPADSSAGFVYVSLTSHLAIPGGTPVAPQYRSYDIPVRFPPGQGYPTLSPSSLNLDSIEGDSGTKAELTVTGSSVAGGCVWIDTPELEAPGRVTAETDPAAASADGCLRVGKGEEQVLEVNFSSTSSETGDVSGSVPVHLSSDIVAGERTISVPVSFAISSPPNAVRRDALLVVLILFGALFPLLFLHLLNYLNARFTGPQDLLFLAQDAEAGPGGLAVSVAPEYTVFKPLTFEGESRKVRTLLIDQLRLRTVASGGIAGLFRGPYGVAEVAGGGPLTAGGPHRPLRTWREGAAQEVPLSLAGTWFFVPQATVEVEPPADFSDLWGDVSAAGAASADADRVRGHLILVIANGGDPEMGKELLAEADRALRDEELRQGLASAPAQAEEVDKPAAVAAPAETADQAVGNSVTDDDPWA